MDNNLTPNILATRYASDEMREIWSAREKIIRERELWSTILEGQMHLGIEAPQGAPAAYRQNMRNVNLDSIAQREEKLRHDLKARLEEFCAISGYECIHRGLTSRDITENVEQMQLRRALELITSRIDIVLAQLANLAEEHADTVLVARTHNVPAQFTTLGKRFAAFGEELYRAQKRLSATVRDTPMRGIYGAVGTASDLLILFNGQKQKIAALNQFVSEKIWDGAPTTRAIGQIYPRSFDFASISALAEVAAAPANISRSIRLMAGNELAHEQQKTGQVGSSAMPHKTNPRISERINGLQIVLHGYLNMISRLSGEQWNEGDVSCSVVRRVALPNACYAAEAVLANCQFLLHTLHINRTTLEKEAQRHLGIISSSALLMAAVKRGMGREEAHACISAHTKEPDMLQRLAQDTEFPLQEQEIQKIVGDHTALIGLAREQTQHFLARVQELRDRVAQSDYPPDIKN